MILQQSFYERETPEVARDLIGKYLVHDSSEGKTVGMIVETEAYLGQGRDPAAHAHKGKTKRNAVLFGPAGYIYVYFIYGMHYCFNISANTDKLGGAVLIRALEPIEGIEIMKKRRKIDDERMLCKGPARLVYAMGLTPQMNGLDAVAGPVWVESHDTSQHTNHQHLHVQATPRIGISKSIDLPLRFVLKGNKFVSA